MGTICFDFDSTLVPCESLEVALGRNPALNAADRQTLADLTAAGMAGAIPFDVSLKSRLKLACPQRDDLLAVADDLARAPTAGAAELIAALQRQGHEVRVISGGLQDLLVPVAATLGVSADRVHGVRCLWAADGGLAGLDPNDLFRISKVDGLRALGLNLARPAIIVGDGATDRALRDEGLMDRFVAYTEHVRRVAVLDNADAEAASMVDLAPILETLLAEPLCD